ncbi:hypothetical protein DID88_003603 [Monilinia fructigena]|uniref:Integrase catalytic domain-containing protein n=1 Tax=Monilinia fructigena TaxID=38457 RepID=A0A395IYZ4_9HELO|nr:hypothetical protein DID88_003603 [Monilinia fructigena]
MASKTTVDTVQTKWGTLIVFKGDNWVEFHESLEAAMIASASLDICTGDEAAPVGNRSDIADWRKRRGIAVSIINSCLPPIYRSQIMPFIRDGDLAGAWIKISTFNNSSNPQHIEDIRKHFLHEQFDPKTESIQVFLDRLLHYQHKTSASDSPISDKDVYSQLLSSLPETEIWQTQRNFITTTKMGLQDALYTLQRAERVPRASTNTATANAVHGSLRGRRTQGARGRGGRNRGGYRTHIRDSITSQNVREVNKIDIKSCKFCEKKGHWQKNCFAYIKAKEALRSNKQTTGDSSAYTAVAHSAIAESEYITSLYFASAMHTQSLNDSDWILDSGASHHFTGSLLNLTNITYWSSPHRVRTANNAYVLSTAFGTASIGNFTLRDVWSYSKGTQPHAGKNGQLEMSAKRLNGNYIIRQPISHHAYMVDSNSETEGIDSNDNKAEIMHRRLGHLNYDQMDKLKKSSNGLQYTNKRKVFGRKACEPCLAGRMNEHFNKHTAVRTPTKLRRLHMDLSGIQELSENGNRYFIVVVDDATRSTWIKYAKDKSAGTIVPILMVLINQIEREFNSKVAIIRADNGRGEFGSQFQLEISKKGLIFEPSPPGKHSMNGVAEKKIQDISATARSLLSESGIEPRMWELTTKHAVYLKNRSPTKSLPFGEAGMLSLAITPYEAMSGRQPDFKKLRIFGCKAWARNPQQPGLTTKKFESRILKGEHIFIGMDGNSIYLLLNLHSNTIYRTADADFDEYRYPLKDLKEKTIPEQPGTVKKRKSPPHDKNITIKRRVRKAQEDVQIHTNERQTAQTRNERQAQVYPSRMLRQRQLQANEPAQEVQVPQSSRQRVQVVVEIPRVRPVPTATLVRDALNDSCKKRLRKIFSDQVVQHVVALQAASVHPEASPISNLNSILEESVELDDAMQGDAQAWMEAIRNELQSLKDNGTFEIMSGAVPAGKKLLSSRYVLRNKLDRFGGLARRKARLVIKGYLQRYGIDFQETFAGVARYSTLRTLLAKAAAEDLEIDNMDVETAFLNGELTDTEILMEVPRYFEEIFPEIKLRDEPYLKLKKSLYGLKQAPRVWWTVVRRFFKEIELEESTADPNLFIGKGVYILLYVDDLLIIGNRINVNSIKTTIGSRWKCKDLGDTSMFLGIQIERNRRDRSLKIHQSNYTKKVLHRFGIELTNTKDLPLPPGTVIRNADKSDLLCEDDKTFYLQIVGSTIYLSNCTRPDIAYAVGQLARVMQAPGENHLILAKHLLQYLAGTFPIGVVYSNRLNMLSYEYRIYTDSTWGSSEDRKSVQGVALIRYGGAIVWSSTKQKSTSLCTMEAEIIAANEGAKDIAWMEKLVKDLGERSEDEPFIPTLYCDNESGVDWMQENKFHSKAKHIDIRWHYIRKDMVEAKRLRIVWIPGTDQTADTLTKQLTYPGFTIHGKGLGLDLEC